ncbi:MAG: cytochrome c-type biogenesis protein [Psychrobium sp.]
MRAVLFSFILVVVAGFSSVANANSVETYTFSKPEYEVRFHELNKILRCPKCQNQNLSDSNSLISQDLRREVRRLLEEGRSDEQIMEYMVMRYGSFVLYKPKLDRVTYFLWYGPIGFGVFGLLVVSYVVVRQRRRSKNTNLGDVKAAEQVGLTENEQAELDKLLK